MMLQSVKPSLHLPGFTRNGCQAASAWHPFLVKPLSMSFLTNVLMESIL